jgi:hypothetical protein
MGDTAETLIDDFEQRVAAVKVLRVNKSDMAFSPSHLNFQQSLLQIEELKQNLIAKVCCEGFLCLLPNMRCILYKDAVVSPNQLVPGDFPAPPLTLSQATALRVRMCCW